MRPPKDPSGSAPGAVLWPGRSPKGNLREDLPAFRPRRPRTGWTLAALMASAAAYADEHAGADERQRRHYARAACLAVFATDAVLSRTRILDPVARKRTFWQDLDDYVAGVPAEAAAPDPDDDGLNFAAPF
jgi:hypothetical protein